MRQTGRSLVILAAVTGCGLPGSAASAGDHTDGGGVFKIGLVSPDGKVAVEGLSAIKGGFARVLGRPVEVMVARDYAALVEAQADGRVDYAVHTTVSFAAASLRCDCVRAIVAPSLTNGAIGFRSVLVERATDELPHPGEVAIGPADSISSRLVPMALYPEADDARFRSRLVEVDTLSNAEKLFQAGEVSGFFGWIWAWPQQTEEPDGGSSARLHQGGIAMEELAISWQSPPIRFGPHAVRKELDEDSVRRLRELLIGGGDTDVTRSLDALQGSFVKVENADYAVAEHILRVARN